MKSKRKSWRRRARNRPRRRRHLGYVLWLGRPCARPKNGEAKRWPVEAGGFEGGTQPWREAKPNVYVCPVIAGRGEALA